MATTPLTPVQIKAQLRANLQTSPPAPPRSNSATSVLTTLENLIDSLSLDTWTPILSTKADGARVVWQVTDWMGGIGPKPSTGQYIGSTGYVTDISQAMNVRGAVGWIPVFALVTVNSRILQQIIDWTGGEGTKPATGQYLGTAGYVTNPSLAVDLRGAQGAPGPLSSGQMTVSTLPTDGLTDTRYYKIASMVSNADYCTVDMIVKGLDAVSMEPIQVKAYFVIRGGFKYEYTGQGPIDGKGGGAGIVGGGASLVAYGDQYNCSIYLKVTSYYRQCAVRVPFFQGAVVESSLVGQSAVPSGLLLFDSEKVSDYRPQSWTCSTFAHWSLGNGGDAYPVYNQIPGFASLMLSGNMTRGDTDLGLMNTNYAGGSGFTFWQQIGAAAKRLLFTAKGNGRFGVNIQNPVAMLDIYTPAGQPGFHITNVDTGKDSWLGYTDGRNYIRGVTLIADNGTEAVSVGAMPATPQKFNVDGNVLTRGVMAYGGLPSIVKGAACNSATLGSNSADMAGTITAVTTSGHTAGAVICTVTFNTPLTRAPKIQLTCMSEAAATNMSKVYVTTTVNGFTLMNTANGLDFGNTYQYAYTIII